MTEAVAWRCYIKRVHLRISQRSHEVPVPESCRSQACKCVEKEILEKVFFCEFCKDSKKTIFLENIF